MNADIEVSGSIRSIIGNALGDCSVSAGGRISSAQFDGAIYGRMEAHQITTVGTNDYFRAPGGGQGAEPRDSYADHLFSTQPLKLNNIYDADGNMQQ